MRIACHTACHVVTQAPSAIIKTEGWCKLSDVALTCFEFIEHCTQAASKLQVVLSPILRKMTYLGTIVQLIKRVKDWSTLDLNDEHIIARIGFLTTLTGGYLLNFFRWLHTIKLNPLGKAIVTVEKSMDMLFTACCVFDLWLCIHGLKESKVESERGLRNKNWWIANQSKTYEIWRQEIQGKIDLNGAHTQKWQRVLVRCTNRDEMIKYCNEKQRRWNDKLADIKYSDIKTWTSIAYDVTIIAAAILAFVLPWIGVSTALCMAIVPFLATVIDLSYYILDNTKIPAYVSNLFANANVST